MVSKRFHSIEESREPLLNIKMQTLQSDVRSSILKQLFQKSKPYPSFCQAIKSAEIRPKEDLTLTEEENIQMQMKANFTKCKKEFSEALSGILYADTLTLLENIEHDNSNHEIVIYVSSMLERSQYLKYTFKL